MRSILSSLLLIYVLYVNSHLVNAQEVHTNSPTALFNGTGGGNGSQVPVSLRPFELTLPREHLFGDWFGLLPKAQKLGIRPTITFVTDIAGNVTGGKSQGVSHTDNLGL